MSRIPLACADFSFPLLPHDVALDLIAKLGIDGVDVSLMLGHAHLPVAEALASIESLLASPSARLLVPGDRYLTILRQLLEQFTGQKVHRASEIDLFEIDPSVIGVPTTAVAGPEDELVPYRHMQEYVERLPQGTLVTLDSIYGHDAFLKEGEALKPIFASVIEAGSR